MIPALSNDPLSIFGIPSLYPVSELKVTSSPKQTTSSLTVTGVGVISVGITLKIAVCEKAFGVQAPLPISTLKTVVCGKLRD